MSEMGDVRTGRGPWLAVAGLVFLQTLVLGWFVWDNETVLANGREVLLDVEPVDPRSLFRGDYVILSYKGLSRLDLPGLKSAEAGALDEFSKLRTGGRLGVIVAPGETGEGWVLVRVVTQCNSHNTEREVCLMGTIRWLGSGRATRKASVLYGVENYFVPEGEGRKLEDAIRIQKLQVVVAVGGNGRGLIKGLVVDGKRVGVEGLF